jgi:hypothetical protein
MPSSVALLPIYATLKALLVAYAPLTALISTKPAGAGSGPAVYDEGNVHQQATMPYLTMGAGTQVPDHTMGAFDSAKWGWNCTLQIKVVGQVIESQGLLILSKVAELLYQGRELNVSGYGSAWCDEFTVQPTISTTLAGVVTREFPAILRVKVYDS